ncbi:unnamed protein product [Amoebophrya sp. A120]|nr:unnamed protein product [Amoebophrya sp. A120]|eukprot:GSA120T00009971001.1
MTTTTPATAAGTNNNIRPKQQLYQPGRATTSTAPADGAPVYAANNRPRRSSRGRRVSGVAAAGGQQQLASTFINTPVMSGAAPAGAGQLASTFINIDIPVSTGATPPAGGQLASTFIDVPASMEGQEDEINLS